MGLGATEAQRALIVGSDAFKTMASPAKDTVIIDGPCACRKYMTRTLSATAVVRMALRSVRSAVKLAEGEPLSIAVLFDRAEFMPPQRGAVAASRRSDAAAADVDVGVYNLEQRSPGHLTQLVPWDAVLLAGGVFKRSAWRIMAEAWYQEVVRSKLFSSILIVGPDFEFCVGPTFASVAVPDFGEADLCVAFVAMEAERRLKRTAIVTIDYDMLLQGLLAFSSTPLHDTHVYYPGAIHNASELCRRYGGTSTTKRWTAALLLVSAFKTDYSSSVCRAVGMKKADIVARMRMDSEDACPFYFDGVGTVTFNVRHYRRLFRRTPPVEDTAKHLWTLFYFGFVHSEEALGAESWQPGARPTVFPLGPFSSTFL